MRLLIALLLFLSLVARAIAQWPGGAAPQANPWGGYALPEQVPYQPMLNSEPALAIPQGAVPVWAEYPPGGQACQDVDAPNQAVLLDNLAPGVAPVVVPMDPGYPGYPGSPAAEPDLKASLIPPGARNGFFQKAKFTATWLPQLSDDSLGWTDLRTEVVTALPFFTREKPILITPAYEVHFLESPEGIFLPPRLHDASIDFHIFRVYDNHWIADFAVTPGIYADDHSFDTGEALRVNGRAVGVYAPTIDWKWVFGVTYLNGGWTKVVPVAGLIFTPNDDAEYQLVFPQPKILWRLTNVSRAPGSDEWWAYIGMEYGNAAWSFQQPDGTQDVLASRDYRALLGFERRIVGGLSHRIELGYVFFRDIKVASISGDDISLDSTLMLRAGVTY